MRWLGFKCNPWSADLSLQTWGNTRVFIESDNGNVWIWEINPSRKLHIKSWVWTAQIESTGVASTLYFWDTSSAVIDNQWIWSYWDDIVITAWGLEKMRITDDGNVWIWTINPSSHLSWSNTTLNVSDVDGADISLERSGWGANLAVWVTSSNTSYVWSTTATPILFGTSSIERMRIKSDGNIGIWTTNPSSRLTVYYPGDNIDVLRLEDDNWWCQFDTNTGTPACTSDERLKKNIKDADSILEDFTEIKIRNFDWKNSWVNQNWVIAQELLEIHPDLVRVDDNGYYFVDQFSSWELIKAIQELAEQNEELKNRIELLENK